MPNGQRLSQLAVVISLVALVVIMAVFISVLVLTGQGNVLTTPAVLTLIGFVALIINQLVIALQNGHTASALGSVQKLVNGHMQRTEQRLQNLELNTGGTQGKESSTSNP